MITQSSEGRFELRDLCTEVGDFHLGPISLTLQRADYMVLMGASGCGKTTLLKSIAGLLLPVSGEILLDGVRIHSRSSQRPRIGYVPQHSLLFPHLSVAENVRFGLRYMGISAIQQSQRFLDVTSLLDITALLDRNPTTLSGGESRRVALARAMAINPAILLLDEPLSMLDPEAREKILFTLSRIPLETGVTIIHVTHILDEARLLNCPTVIMERGRIIA